MGGLIAGVHGRIDASFRPGSGARPLARVLAESPLELRGPFLRSSKPALYLLRNTTAGVLADDTYDLRIDVESARVQIASTAASRAFAMPGSQARIRAGLSVRDGGCLTWGPHPTILQAGSSLTQETVVCVEDGATALLAEVLVLGRLASGERCNFDSYENALQVLNGHGDPLYEERYRLTPGPELDASLGGCGALASVYYLGSLSPATESALRDDSAASWPSLAGWSPLPNQAGIVARCLTASLSDGMAFVTRCLALLDAQPASAPELTVAALR